MENHYQSDHSPEYILSMLLRQFKILFQIRQLLDNNYTSPKIISSLSLHPFVVNKGINQAKNFEISTIKKIINELTEVEFLGRSGKINLKAAISLIVNKI